MGMDDHIRKALLGAMSKQGISQAELARRMGVQPQSITKLLSGDRGKVPQSVLRALDTLGLELVVRQKGQNNA